MLNYINIMTIEATIGSISTAIAIVGVLILIIKKIINYFKK